MVKLLIVSCRSLHFLNRYKDKLFLWNMQAHAWNFTLFSHPQYERIANTRGWRSFIFGLALAERQRAAPISDQTCFQHTSVSTCISELQYLRLSTGVLAYRYWSTEPSVLTRREKKILRKQPHAANANPKIKLYYSEKHPFAQRKKSKKTPISS